MKMDDEIQETVESILGKGVKVVDCEKKSCVKEEEVLLINGCPIKLEGEDGAAIRQALLHGTVPHCDLLNQILVRAGILRAPVRLETSLSVKSSVVTREEVTVARGGQVVDERSRETKEDNFYTSTTSEVWEPIGVIRNASDKRGAVNKIDHSTSTSDFHKDDHLSTSSSASTTSSSSRPNSDSSTESPLFTTSSQSFCSSNKTPTFSSRTPSYTNSTAATEPRFSLSSSSSSHSPTPSSSDQDHTDYLTSTSSTTTLSNGLRNLNVSRDSDLKHYHHNGYGHPVVQPTSSAVSLLLSLLYY